MRSFPPFGIPGISFYAFQVRVQRNREFDVLLDQASKHLVYIADRLIDIQDHRLNDLLATKH